MKTLKIVLVVAFLFFYNFANSQFIALNCEKHEANKSANNTDNQQYDLNRCWMFSRNIIYTNISKITGSYSAVSTGILINSPGYAQICSPWIRLKPGSITLRSKLTACNGTVRKIQVYYTPYNSNKSSDEGIDVLFNTYNWSSINTSVNYITVPIPSLLANALSPYKIKFSLMGTSGASNIIIDDIVIPGTYDSDFSYCAGNPLSVTKDTDTDGDGVKDSDDAYPNDVQRAYNTYYPASGYGTLFFEDLWPSSGDYDFNDLVLGYRYQKVTNSLNNIVELKATFIRRAIGGNNKNGFAIQLNEMTSNQIKSVVGVKTFNSSWLILNTNGTEKGQAFANIVVFDNVDKIMTSSGGGLVNTIPANLFQSPDTTQVIITFASNQINGDLLVINPYLIADMDRGREIHLPNYVPTSKANRAYFGQKEDNSIMGGAYYKSKTNLPWALDIPRSIAYPQEKKDFISVYLKFASWAQSSGVLYPDWYINKTGFINWANAYAK